MFEKTVIDERLTNIILSDKRLLVECPLNVYSIIVIICDYNISRESRMC